MDLGVNIHLSEPQQRDVEMIAAAGFGFVRMDFTWADIERQKGVYDFSGYEDLVGVYAEHGTRSLIILAYGNPLYDNSPAPFHVGPHTEQVQQAFARFAAAAAAKLKGRQVVWEIWNEPNNPDFWQPAPNADQYTTLIRITSQAIRQADAHAMIIAPALTLFPQPHLDPWSFLERSCMLGLLEYVDALSVHPYRRQFPETVTADYQRLRTLITRYAPSGKETMPIISSEWGYPVIGDLSQADQAALFVREFLVDVLNDVRLNIWYDWHDDGQDPRKLEDNFGIVTWDYQPKLAYLAAQLLVKQLSGFQFVRRLTLPSQNDYAMLFAHDTIKKLALWTIDAPHTVQLPIPVSGPSATLVSMTGETRALRITNGTLVIELTGSPQYLQLPC